MNKNDYRSAYGSWYVTTEGDVEGRSTTVLGTFEGYLDEIAFQLARQACYSLTFRKVDTKPASQRTASRVSVQLNIDSGTWDMSSEDRAQFVREMLSGRNVAVEPGQYYASVWLYDGASPEEQERKKMELARTRALSKLTPEDRKLLGLGE